MKKIMITLLMVAATLNAMAITYTGKVKVRLTSSDNKYCEAVVATSDDFIDGLNNSYYVAFNDENKDVHLYVDFAGTRYAHFGSSATTMRNMPLIMKANSATSYSLSFSAMVGTIDIYDKKLGVHIDKSQNYDFTVEDSERDANDIVANRFVINYTYVTMSGDFDNVGGSWAYLPTPFTHNGATASKELTLDADTWYSFQIDVNGAIGADDYDFDSDHKSHVVPTTGWIEKLSLHTDIAGVYTFTWEYATNTLAITFPVPPTPTSYTVTPNSFGYASFSAAEATVIPTTGVTVYKGAINGEVLDLSPITDYIPANTGVIVMGTAGQPYEFEVTSAAVVDLSDNALKAYTDWASHSGTIFVLKDEALYRYTGSDFPNNKAYLQISSANNAPKRISLRFNGATAIDNVEAGAQAEKFVENGQIYIRRGNEVFNLQGQIVK